MSLALSQASPSLRPEVTAEGAVWGKRQTDTLSTHLNLLLLRLVDQGPGQAMPHGYSKILSDLGHVSEKLGDLRRWDEPSERASCMAVNVSTSRSAFTVLSSLGSDYLVETAEGERGLSAHSFGPSWREKV